MSRFKKGDLIKFSYTSKNIYMLIEELEANVFFLIRVKRKDGRFDIRRSFVRKLDKTDNIISLNDFPLDKRDLDIFNQFQHYVINNKFKIIFQSYTHCYTHFKPKLYWTSYNIIKNNINLSIYKKYSNKI